MVAGAAFASAAFGYEPNELRHTLPGRGANALFEGDLDPGRAPC